MSQAGFEHTTLGRAYVALEEWWEEEHTRGIWATKGEPWGSHPSWRNEADREWWHKNWGELLNFHSQIGVRVVMTNGVSKNVLTISTYHAELDRLERVKNVTGGTLTPRDHPGSLHRLRIERIAAFYAMKAGRAYVNPTNRDLIEVLDAAMRFQGCVPKQGMTASDYMISGQEYWKSKVTILSGFMQGLGSVPHDCGAAIKVAGWADWGAEDPKEAPYTVF